MKKFDIKNFDFLGIGVAAGSLILGLAKMKLDANKKEAEKAEIVKEVMEQLSSKND